MEDNSVQDGKDLLLRMATGDETAFRQLHSQFYTRLTYFAFQLTQYMPQAEDIASVALTKLWDKRTNFPHIGAVQSFLYTTARNAAINYLESQKVRRKALPLLRQQAAETDDFADQVTAFEVEAELLQHIYDAMESLPPKTRTIFEMLYFEQMTTEAVAEKLSIPVQTVRNNKTRALDQLRIKLIARNISPIWLLLLFSDNIG